MSLFNTVTTKPWEVSASNEETSSLNLPEQTVGLRLLLVVMSSLFMLLISAYLMRMSFGDWQSLTEPWQLWLNTAMLILSSIALQQARKAAAKHQPFLFGLFIGGLLAVAFIAGQLWAWQQLVAQGVFVAANPANSFFYLITALHGLHLLGGLVVLLYTGVRIWQGVAAQQLSMTVDLCAVYWHFLLVVWLVLFTLLLLT